MTKRRAGARLSLMIVAVGLVVLQSGTATGRDYARRRNFIGGLDQRASLAGSHLLNFLVSVSDVCNGVILSDRHVLAPGKCVRTINGRPFVRFGADNLHDPSNGKVINAGLGSFHAYADLTVFELRDKIQSWINPECAHSVRSSRSDYNHCSSSSRFYLMGFETSKYGVKGCSGHKVEIEMKLEPDNELCGFRRNDSIICARADNDLLLNDTADDQCSGVLVEEHGNFLGIESYRTLVGMPTNRREGSLEKNVRAFTKISNYRDWIMKKTEGTAIY